MNNDILAKFISKLDNVKDSDRIKKLIGRGKYAIAAAALVIATSLSGCGNSNKNNNDNINYEMSIDEVANAIEGADSYFETLDKLKFNGKSWYEYAEEWDSARKEESQSRCNRILYGLGRLILEAQVIHTLGISPDNVIDFEFGVPTYNEGYRGAFIKIKYKEQITELAAGGVSIDKENIVEKEFGLGSEVGYNVLGYNMAYNAEKACYNGWKLADTYGDPSVDDVYVAYMKFLLCTGEVKGKKIVFSEDSSKIIDTSGHGRK